MPEFTLPTMSFALEERMNAYEGPAFARFIRSISMLAVPYDLQLRWLRSVGCEEPTLCDELALEFDDGLMLLPQFLEQAWLSERACTIPRELSSLLDGMSSGDKLQVWDVGSLETAAEWAAVRELAFRFLETI